MSKVKETLKRELKLAARWLCITLFFIWVVSGWCSLVAMLWHEPLTGLVCLAASIVLATVIWLALPSEVPQ